MPSMYRKSSYLELQPVQSNEYQKPVANCKETQDVYVVITEEISVSNFENAELTDALKPIIAFCMTRMKRKKTKIKKTRMNLTVERMIKGMVLSLLMELVIMSIVTHQ